tara:strand:+ start:298 stop:408 length:111 start_codon:yes stop_codon:yes gene_type:complete
MDTLYFLFSNLLIFYVMVWAFMQDRKQTKKDKKFKL